MKGNPYSRMIQTMQRQGEKKNEQPMSTGVVMSVDPLRIKYNNVEIVNGVHCRFPRMPETMREEIEKEENISNGLKQFLTGLYDAFNLEEDDVVIVQKSGNNLYILGKM